MSKKFSIAIRSAVSGSDNTLELHFLDLIYDTAQFDWWTGEVVETNIVQEIIDKIKAANPSRILCLIDSEGGDAGIGLAIYNYLKSYPAKVEVDIIGMCGSAATMPAMAANKCKLRMARNAFMVIHQAWGGGLGTSNDLRQQADVIDRYTAQYVDIYAQRSGKSNEEIAALIAGGDYWMSGTEALAMGLCDELTNNTEGFQISARVQSLDSHYHNIPSNLIEAPAGAPTEEQPAGIFQSLKTEIMNLKGYVSAFIDSLKGKEIKADAPDISAAVSTAISEPMTAFAEALQTDVSAEIESLRTEFQGKIDALTEENKQLREEAAEKLGAPTTDTNKPSAEAKPLGYFHKK